MGFGKILGLAALGVGAVAAAPFTGGGSLFGAATLGASLAGAGAIATGAGVAGAAAGAAWSRKDDENEQKKDEEISSLNKKAEKFQQAFEDAVNEFKGDKEYFNYIIACSAVGIAAANSDGEIVKEEIDEINEFVGGISNANYPKHVVEAIAKLIDNPPTLNEAISYMKHVQKSNHESIRDLIELVIEADGKVLEEEKAFLEAFNYAMKMVKYTAEREDNDNKFVNEIKERLSA
ncbi:hypothetical protein SMGD1_0270 [Sulfurimonas gotlandica GD1]|uniref:Co-chaperone DjlA N-terminal domain-containing protein n=1 Tax=Sulfurimonas gotlandica (strain DSM 19862 / JCM 16533 / GD1) TaxID=929558 RepID=B6BL59_SULGG|nr:TerB family tellurite resistance protein [Sulfurimonas gotlandica]EDZ62137.1 hypothetical protein CBGD1_2717 [Sulfurimonas gotlandica GD1]EHP28797.1 hypothetical protein SMGD1_0270 [Sulfurimonas gotlandica GD1]